MACTKIFLAVANSIASGKNGRTKILLAMLTALLVPEMACANLYPNTPDPNQ